MFDIIRGNRTNIGGYNTNTYQAGDGEGTDPGPEVDGSTRVVASSVAVGSLVDAVVVEADGIDLIATEAP